MISVPTSLNLTYKLACPPASQARVLSSAPSDLQHGVFFHCHGDAALHAAPQPGVRGPVGIELRAQQMLLGAGEGGPRSPSLPQSGHRFKANSPGKQPVALLKAQQAQHCPQTAPGVTKSACELPTAEVGEASAPSMKMSLSSSPEHGLAVEQRRQQTECQPGLLGKPQLPSDPTPRSLWGE